MKIELDSTWQKPDLPRRPAAVGETTSSPRPIPPEARGPAAVSQQSMNSTIQQSTSTPDIVAPRQVRSFRLWTLDIGLWTLACGPWTVDRIRVYSRLIALNRAKKIEKMPGHRPPPPLWTWPPCSGRQRCLPLRSAACFASKEGKRLEPPAKWVYTLYSTAAIESYCGNIIPYEKNWCFAG